MPLVTYKKYNDQQQAESLAELLHEKGIAYEITEDRDNLASFYGDNQFRRDFYVKIRKEDFEKADSILLAIGARELETVDKDHYLFGFTDEELFDILRKADEWNELDFLLAKKILKERGKEINDDTVALLKKERINELSKPEQGHRIWLYIGYISAIFGGLLGIFIGWHLMTFKKTLPNGQRVYGFNASDRIHGSIILIIGSIVFLIAVATMVAAE
jgi:hypothetical protein